MNNIRNVIFLVGFTISGYMLAKNIASYVKSAATVEWYRVYQCAESIVLGSACLVFAYYGDYIHFFSIVTCLNFASVPFSYLIDKHYDRKDVELYCEFQKMLSKLDDSGFQHTQQAYELRAVMGRIISELPKKYREEIIEREKELDKQNKT